MKTKFAYIVLGFSTLVSQVTVLREFTAIFQGNELSWGIVLASWLLWVALGSGIVVQFLEKFNPETSFVGLQILASIVSLLTIGLIKSIHPVLGIPFGQLIGFIPLIISTLFLAPMCILWGIQFSLGGKLLKESSPAVNVSQVYVYETVGAIIGGVLYNYLFAHYFNSLQTITIIGIVNIISSILLSSKLLLKNWTNYKNIYWQEFLPLLLIVFISILSNGNSIYYSLNQFSIGKNYQLIESKDSIYGNVTVLKRENQYSFYENGMYSFATENELVNEEIVHFPLLQCDNIQQVLLIGGVGSGCLEQILSYPGLKEVYAIELDPTIIKLTQKYLSPKSFTDSRVKIVYTDGISFIKNFVYEFPEQKFDAIILNLPDPNSVQINRFYTLEFFQQIKNILQPQGIFSFGLTSSETYFTDELKQFNGSIYSAVKIVFPKTLIIPGTYAFFISSPENRLTSDVKLLSKKIKTLSPQPEYISEPYLKSRIQQDRIRFVTKTLDDEISSGKIRINRDFSPITYFHTIVLWIQHFQYSANKIFVVIEKINFLWMIVLCLILFFIFPRGEKQNVFYTTLVSGMVAMGGEIVLLLSFQTLFGYLYYRVALMITIFMIGLFIGSQLTKNIISKNGDNNKQLLIINQTLLSIFLCVLPLLLTHFAKINNSFFPQLVLLLAIGTIGLLSGTVFPLANDLCLQEIKKENTSTQKYGKIYTLDLIGGCIGAILSTLIFVPLLGISQTLVLLGIISLTSVVKLLWR